MLYSQEEKKAPLKNLPQGNKQDTKIPGYSFENSNNPGTLLTWRTSWPVGRYGIFSGHRWTRLENKKRSHKLSLKYFSLRSAPAQKKLTRKVINEISMGRKCHSHFSNSNRNGIFPKMPTCKCS